MSSDTTGPQRFVTEIQARYRDINLGNHVDSVEAIRIIDEARIQLLRFAALTPPAGPRAGLLGGTPDHVSELVAGQRIDYHAEMRFVPFSPFQVTVWVSRVGSSSIDFSTELRVVADHPPALIAQTTMVLLDHRTQKPWTMDDDVRATFERFLAPPVGLRQPR